MTSPALAPSDLEMLLRHVGNLVTPMAVRVAATLRLVDHLLAGVGTVPELAAATATDPQSLDRLVRHLRAAGVLTGGDGEPLRPTGIGLLLADDHPAQQRAWLDLTGAVSRADLSFIGLLDAVRTGQPVYQALHGRPFWEDLSVDPQLAASFDALMSGDKEAEFEAPVAAYDWSSVRHVLDVGGGTGALLATIARRAPTVRGTLLELPGPAGRARDYLRSAGVADRITVLDADFFAPPPVTADVVLLSFVLLNWPDDDARKILLRCAEALEPDGRVVVFDRADDPDQGPEPFLGTLLDMRMLAFMGGRVRTRREITDLAGSAGLTLASARTVSSSVVPFDFAMLELTVERP